MAFGKIYSYPGNYRVDRALVAAAFNKLEVTMAENFAMGQTNQSPEFLAKFPMGKVPALECADGFCLAEGAAIAHYLAGSGPAAEQLLGADAKTRARIAEWAFLSESEVTANINPIAVMTVFKMVPLDEGRVAYHSGAFKRVLQRIELALQDDRKFLVGDKPTYADIMVSGPLFFALGIVLDAEIKASAPKTVAYLKGLQAIPEFQPFSAVSL